ncbi:HNH endonuclease [Planktothrix sp. FACHB-1355]|uniref:HNH endonuclease n=1 Tax=Aerosakkonema funiforme FACHB-1375 TaxID=2949571 RepID=A0A926VLC2_9CYAN|nr:MULTISPECIES: HNH endonuclease signature motif containing protein [Oscillatoriales]MBD2186047.1 HNH endonuclease [Aerosakkonema funiforme FACHB-1375]MBD3558568.1 HNH endonuclease [Planktothrix sp. FACHB-1355]
MTYIPAALRRTVEERANYRCEYCLLPAGVAFFPHEVDHAIAEKHGGATDADNLALACWRCNRHKGTDLGSFDPQTGAFSFLFNPRTQQWNEHFRLEEVTIVGLTPEGRTTVNLLQLNSDERLAERRRLLAENRPNG